MADQENAALWTIKAVPVHIREKAVRYARMDGCTMAEWLSKAVETHVSRQDGNQIIPPDKPEQTPFPLVDTVLYAALLVLGIFGLMLIVALPFG